MDYALLASIGLAQELFTNKIISAKTITLDKESIIFQSGDECGAFLLLTQGQVRVEMTCKSGRDITLYRMHEKQTCIITTSVLLNHETYYARATAETPVTAIAISSEDFHKAIKHSTQFAQYILTGYAQRMGSLIKLLDKVASKDISLELNHFLLEHTDSAGFIHITQESIAKELGTAREVISRKLSQLEQAGLVITHRGKVEVLKPKELENSITVEY